MKSKLPIPEDKLIFKDIWVGGLSKEDLLKNLKIKGIGINEFAMQIINHNDFTVSPIRKKLRTVEISIGDLGFLKGAATQEVYQKAKELGLKYCPPELGLHMRLQYIDFNQPIDPPKGNWQNIAMKKLSDDPDFLMVFTSADERMVFGYVVIAPVLNICGTLAIVLFSWYEMQFSLVKVVESSHPQAEIPHLKSSQCFWMLWGLA